MMRREPLPQGACAKFEPDLVLYYYGECGDTERRSLETHLAGCRGCASFLDGLKTVLPATIERDDPPPSFWEGYSREMRAKLLAAEQKSSPWARVILFLRPWPVPVLATALVLILGVTLTLTKGKWRSEDVPAEEEALLEVLPLAENLEFLRTMELLDAMDELPEPS
jgi:hypothetical protein